MPVRSGGMLNALGPKAGRKLIHPDTGDVTVICEVSIRIITMIVRRPAIKTFSVR